MTPVTPFAPNAEDVAITPAPIPAIGKPPISLPKVVINLPARTDRWQTISARMANAGLTDLVKVPAIEGARLPYCTIARLTGLPTGDIDLPPRSHLSLTRPALGCFLSHLAVWRWVIASGHPRVLVFEDDAAPGPTFDLATFEGVVAQLPIEAGLVFVGRIIMAGLAEPPSGQCLPRLYHFNGTFAYLITPAACTYLIEHLGRPKFHIDHQMSALLYDRREEFSAYYTDPAFFEPDWALRSDCYVPLVDETRADQELEAMFAARRQALLFEVGLYFPYDVNGRCKNGARPQQNGKRDEMKRPVPRIVVTNRAFPETIGFLSSFGAVLANETPEPWGRDEVIANCRGADALMAFMTDCVDASLISACPDLKVIGAALKGYDNIDVVAAESSGVWVTIVPDLLTIPTAELAITLMLGLGRHIRLGDQAIRRSGFHGWRPTLYGQGLEGSTVGIIGFGKVGQAVAERLIGFRTKVLAWDKVVDASGAKPGGMISHCSLDPLLRSSDFVVLALPLTPDTTHIINRTTLKAMKPGALLINPARGSLVDEAAVADAIESGHLGGYAADVFACEDWARSDRPPAVDPRLLQSGAPTLLTPHLGSAVTRNRRQIEMAAARSIVEALSGRRPSHAVNAPTTPRAGPCCEM